MIEAEDPDSQDDRQTRDIVQYQEYHLSLAGLRPISKFTKHSFTNHPDVVPTRQIHISKESQKMAVVMISNAVVHPWTVMVHFEHTSFTGSTMVSSRRLGCFTSPAVAKLTNQEFLSGIELLTLDQRDWIPIFRDPPRIGRDAEEVIHQEQGDEDVEWQQQA